MTLDSMNSSDGIPFLQNTIDLLSIIHALSFPSKKIQNVVTILVYFDVYNKCYCSTCYKANRV